MGRGFDQGRGASPWQPPVVDRQKITDIVAHDQPENLVTLADRYGKDLAYANLATAQIRGIFGAVRSMQGNWDREETRQQGKRALLMLKPKLGYQAARLRPTRPGDPAPVQLLRDLLIPAIDAVGDDVEKFRRFVDYFEALLAYHKAHGGADKSRDNR